MKEQSLLRGVVLVGLGATSYGMLATFVKLAYQEGYTTAEVTSSQFVLGILGTWLITLFSKNRNSSLQATRKDKIQLLIAGTSLGMTSIFYYLAVKFIPVSIGIVLLMQTVWMGVLLEYLLDKKAPSRKKILAVLIVFIGTLMATKIFEKTVVWNFWGLFWGLLAAASFTATMFTANRIATKVPSSSRSLWLLFGGAILVFIFCILTQKTPFNFTIFYTWGIVLSLFGTIVPPILMNAGFPKTGIGLGSIVSSLELPVSVAMAYFLLNEKVSIVQWFGIICILFAILLMNLQPIKNKT